jgi:hypothetical protein
VPRIAHIQWWSLGRCRWRDELGVGAAMCPSPVDHDACLRSAGFADFADCDDAWHQDFTTLLDDVVSLLSRFGAAVVHGLEPVPASWWDRVLRRRAPPWSPASRLELAASDDQFGTCGVEFGDPVRAAACTSDGHPIIWAWIRAGVDGGWPAYLAPLARGRPFLETALDLSTLGPPSPLHLVRGVEA